MLNYTVNIAREVKSRVETIFLSIRNIESTEYNCLVVICHKSSESSDKMMIGSSSVF